MYLLVEFVGNASFLGHALDILMNSKSSEFGLISMICDSVTRRICNRGKLVAVPILSWPGLSPHGPALKCPPAFSPLSPLVAGGGRGEGRGPSTNSHSRR